MQYEGSSNGTTWTILQSFNASLYKTLTSDTYTATEYKFYRASVRARNSNKDFDSAAYSDGGTSSSYVYISATGTSPGQPTIGVITVTTTTASAAFTHPTNTGSATIDWIQFSLNNSTWYNDFTSPFADNPPLGGLTAGTAYTLYARALNYDGLYSATPNTSKAFTTNAATLYTITFDSKGGTAVSSLSQATEGGSIAKPTDPTKTNNTFGGWTTTDGGTTAVTWPRTPTGNETLYAKWTSTAVAPSAPAAPTVGTLSYSHNSVDLATTLTRVSNTAKTQAWTYTAEVGFPLTWVKPTGATDFEIYTNSTGTAPASSTSGNSSTSTGDVTTYTYWTTQSNRGTITRYFWVKAKNSTGSSGWSPVSTAKTSVATVVSGLAIRLYRGNGTTYSSPSSAPAATALSYAWTGITDRGNPNASPFTAEGHYATVNSLTIAGTSDSATSLTV